MEETVVAHRYQSFILVFLTEM